MFVLYWFFQYYFCFSKLHTTLKTSWKYKHSFVSCSCHSFTNSKLCMLNSSKIFTRLWYGSNIETLSRKICEFFWIQNWWNYALKIFYILICPSPMSWNPSYYVFEALDLVEYMDHMELQLPGFQHEPKLILVEDCILSILVCYRLKPKIV